MTIEAILSLILGGTTLTSIGSGVIAVFYRKQNKKLKEIEVKIKETESEESAAKVQKDKIDLAEMFTQKAADMFKQMQELQEQTYLATKNNGKDNETIIKTVNEIASEQKNIVAYLNGGYQEFLSHKTE